MKSRSLLSLAILTVFLTACTTQMPSAGPSAKNINTINEIKKENQNNQNIAIPKVAIVDLNDDVSLHVYAQNQTQSFGDLGNANPAKANVINSGDVLDITIWESPPALLFGGALNSTGSGTAQNIKLPEQMVNEQGRISVPFLGAIVVRGKTSEQVQNEIVSRLKRMANQPQAMVRVVQNNSANVTVIRAGKSIRMPLTAQGERVLDAIAAIGGSESDVRDVSVQLTRRDLVRTVSLEEITANPSQNIYLRPNDVLTLQIKPLSYTAFGALGKNQQFRFSAKGINLGEALSEAGGLLDRRADASGVFVFRYQTIATLPANVQQTWLAQGYAPNMTVPVVYRADLRNAHAMFWLQRFPIQDKDMVYVANAPMSELQKFLQLVFSPVVSGVNSIQNLGQ